MDNKSSDEISEEKEVIPGYKTFDSYLQEAYPVVAQGIKSSNSLPSAREFSYYRTYPEFVNIMKNDGMRLDRLMKCLLMRNGLRKTDEGINSVIDSNDKSLDRANDNLLEMDGRKRNPIVTKTTSSVDVVPSGGWHDIHFKNVPSKEDIVLCLSTNVIRPQINFKDKIDNSNSPWIPRIQDKPNALKPLSVLPCINDIGEECYSHPYDYELMLWKPKEELLSKTPVKKPLPLEKTPFIYVETEDQLNGMLSELKNVDEFAVDLEHHSYRTFLGFTCLMQISTWQKDYVIDTLKLRDKLHILNEVFTKSTILKVFHGAESDIEWLQRDLSLYVINMFDTYQASKVLGFQRLSLAHLLYKYTQVEAKKEFQLFDWRRRPLPDDAIKYAREDTHYLLYIYQLLKNELIDQAHGKTNLLETVFERSCETCKKVYIKPSLNEESHMTVYRRLKLNFDNRQLYALREIYRWRDRVARQEDESTGYVLPNHMMVQICRTLPREMQGILACCNPIPPLVRTYLLELHQIVLRAKEQPLVKTLVDENAKSGIAVEKDHRLIYPQDNDGLEFRDDLPTLLGGGLPTIAPCPSTSPIISAFEELVVSERRKLPGKIKFVSPYQRYIKVLPYAIQLEKEEREQKEKEEEERLSNATNSLDINRTQEESSSEEDLPEPLVKNRSYVRKARTEKGDLEIKIESDEESKEKEDSPKRSIGVVGGIVTLENPRKKLKPGPVRDEFGWTIPNVNGSYDYSKVNYDKFQSKTDENKRKEKISQRLQNSRKRRRDHSFEGATKKSRKNQMKKNKLKI